MFVSIASLRMILAVFDKSSVRKLRIEHTLSVVQSDAQYLRCNFALTCPLRRSKWYCASLLGALMFLSAPNNTLMIQIHALCFLKLLSHFVEIFAYSLVMNSTL